MLTKEISEVEKGCGVRFDFQGNGFAYKRPPCCKQYLCPTCQAKLSTLKSAQQKFDKLKQLWREKCKRMDIMSGRVAIFELECILDELSSKQEGKE